LNNVIKRLTTKSGELLSDARTGLRLYETCILPLLFCGSVTWTLLPDDRRRLQSFHIQHQLPGIKWHFFIRKTDIADTTGLPSIQEIIDNRRFALFGHVVRLCARIPAQQALKFSIATRSGHRPNARWSKTPVCPRSS